MTRSGSRSQNTERSGQAVVAFSKRDLLKLAVKEIPPPRDYHVEIPRDIFFTKGPGELGAEIKNNIFSVSKINPGWTVSVFEDADIEKFIAEHYGPAVLAVFNLINPKYGAAKADFFRYLIVYKLGGLYLDLKSTTTRPLDEWLLSTDECIISQWENSAGAVTEGWGLHPDLSHIKGGEFVQWFVLSRPYHPILYSVCLAVIRNIVNYGPMPLRFGRDGVFRVTGPVCYTLAVDRVRATCRHRYVPQQELGLQYSIFSQWDGHYSAAATHYSRLFEPIVHLSGFSLFIFRLLRGIFWRVFGLVSWFGWIFRNLKSNTRAC